MIEEPEKQFVIGAAVRGLTVGVAIGAGANRGVVAGIMVNSSQANADRSYRDQQ